LSDEPALFRTFAATLPDEEGILAFANTWGLLGFEADRVVGDTPLAARPVESFITWVRAISEMRQVVWAWDRLTSASRDEQRELLDHVRWDRDEDGHVSVAFDSHPHLSRRRAIGDDGYARVAMAIATNFPDPEGLAQFEEGEVTQPARTFVFRTVSRNLQGRVSPRLVPGPAPMMRSRLPVLGALQLTPVNLYAGLWLQFAQVASGEREQRRCPGCGRWFEAKVTRSDRMYCGDACRKDVHQRKKLLARRLHAEGKKAKEIAQELGVDVAQVKKWMPSTRGWHPMPMTTPPLSRPLTPLPSGP
jgi:hypothetical protein